MPSPAFFAITSYTELECHGQSQEEWYLGCPSGSAVLEWRMLPVCHYLYDRLGETGNLGPATRLRDGQAAAANEEGPKHPEMWAEK
ncbi:hypothetical protein FQA47_007811 [Oryzias melastigma]|uniref:Uncharacterized protein n=1 Tax=Oryzias melastigma TaxID=30732 RepID=A0A834FPT2_ORYME|nr:hypothetical protein FQA47_007811 [Oryzias melastigma]